MSESEAQSTQAKQVIIVHRIIKYDVPDDNNYSDTIQELKFMSNMANQIYPVDGTTFEAIRVEDITHVDGMKPNIEVIPEKDNVQPTDKDETIVVHFTPVEGEQKPDLDEDSDNESEEKQEENDPVNTIANLLNQQFESETPEEPQIISKSDDNEEKQAETEQDDEPSEEPSPLESEIELEEKNNDRFKDIEELEQEEVPDKAETFLASLNIPVTKREEYLIIRRHRNVHPIPLSQDKAWLRSIPQVCEVLSNLQQIGEIDMTPDSYDMWYYRH